MAQTSWPRVNEDTTDSQYGEFFATAIVGTGVRDATGLAVTPGSGLAVNVAAGFAVVAGNAYLSTAVEPLTIAANTGTTARTDLVVLRRDFTAAAGKTVVLAVKTGPAGGAVPTLTQDVRAVWEEPLAAVSVAVNAATLATGNITDRRSFLSSRVGMWTNGTRPPAKRGGIGFNTEAGVFEASFNGTSWGPLLDWANIANKPATFPPSAHSHAAADLPTVPINKGGTGATDAVAALQALGIYVQATDPGQANGRVWIKRT